MKFVFKTSKNHGLSSLAAARAGCVLGALLAGADPSLASQAIVIGDSIGVGVSMAAGVPRLAHNSVTIRGSDALSQLRRAPRDSVAFISLGANDAAGSLAGVERGVDKLVAAAKDANLRAVWIGPPCVMKPWNTNVVKLDEILKNRLAGRMAYVSIADRELCDRSLRAGDGVHFNMRGYSLLWERAREAAGVEIDARPAQNESRAQRRADREDREEKKAEIVRAATSPETLPETARTASDAK
jgi:hypothetical protein